jgi:IMP dehydrogenase
LGNSVNWPDIQGINPSSITYDDVLLVPQPQTGVISRRQSDISVDFGPFHLRKPIITAPMDTITGERMMELMFREGGLGVLPRMVIDEASTICKRLSKKGVDGIYAVGLEKAYDQAKELKKAGAQAILIDVAHGGMRRVLEAAVEITQRLKLFYGNRKYCYLIPRHKHINRQV